MQFFRNTLVFGVLLVSTLTSNAQAHNDSLSFEEQFALLEAEMDSMSIFELIDSLLSIETPKYSELNFRMGYNSNVLSAGRTYGIEQHSLSPGISYYHQSGIYLDYTGFWNSATDPKYNLSIFTAGYLGSLSPTLTFTGNYERWMYSNKDDNGLNNSIGGSISYRKKWFYSTVDYGLLFGNGDAAHRIIGSLTGNITIGRIWKSSRLALMPSASVLFGNENITLYRFSQDDRAQQLLQLRELNTRDIQRLYSQGKITRKEAFRMEATRRFTTSDSLTPEQEARLTELLYDVEQTNSFGVMNYSFSVPMLLYTPQWSFILSYTYSIPVSLPGEELSLDPVGFFGASITYRLPFK